SFANKQPHAAKAAGALKRLELEGKVLELQAPVLGTTSPFNIATLRSKFVVVYYWASWNQQCVGDFAKLKLLLDSYASKGLELVCVNLDDRQEDATGFRAKVQAPGTQLYLAGQQGQTGLESKLATDYGIMVLPTLFFVGKDGKVISRTVQVSTLEE